MATPKLDNLAVEFVKRIGEEFQSAFTPGNAMPNGKLLLTKDEIISYINRSLFILINKYWDAVKGNRSSFILIFPELIRIVKSRSTTNSIYDFPAGYKDFAKVVGAVTTTGKRIQVWKTDEYIQSQEIDNPFHNASVDRPALIESEGKLLFFPEGTEFTFNLQYIKNPVNPQDGSFLTQNGAYDSPFTPQWNNQIVEIAHELYKKESQETS